MEEFSRMWLGQAEPKERDIKGEEDFKKVFSRLKDSDGSPRPLTMKVGKGDRNAEFDGFSVQQYFKKATGSDA